MIMDWASTHPPSTSSDQLNNTGTLRSSCQSIAELQSHSHQVRPAAREPAHEPLRRNPGRRKLGPDGKGCSCSPSVSHEAASSSLTPDHPLKSFLTFLNKPMADSRPCIGSLRRAGA